MPNCSVICCKKRSNSSSLQKDGVTFHLFPKIRETREAWTKFCNNQINWYPKRTSAICSIHFEPHDFEDLANKRRILRENTIPTLLPDCTCPRHILCNQEPSSPEGGGRSASPDKVFIFLSESAAPQDQVQLTANQEVENWEKDCKCNVRLTSDSQPVNPKPTPIEIVEVLAREKERKMQRKIDFQHKKIKRLNSKILYMRKKVASLKKLLNKQVSDSDDNESD